MPCARLRWCLLPAFPLQLCSAPRLPACRPLAPAQTNVLGTYPFHWHLVGDASGQVATDNSVYRWGGVGGGVARGRQAGQGRAG